MSSAKPGHNTQTFAPSGAALSTTRVRAGALLDTWCRHAWREGVQVEYLRDLESLVVRTQNSIYELTVISSDTGEVLVRGGAFFPEFTPARLAGSSLGGSFLKRRGIYVGFRMEIHVAQWSIVTSPVQSIGVREAPSDLESALE